MEIANCTNISRFVTEELDTKMYEKADKAINGIQVENEGEWKKLAICVDFCMETLNEAIRTDCQAMLVHHGIFWGNQLPISGRHYQLISKLIKHNIALLALHLPLDMDLTYGNNIGLIEVLGLEFVKKFSDYKGLEFLFLAKSSKDKSDSQSSITLAGLVEDYEKKLGKPLSVVGDGRKKIKTLAVCSGGGLFGLESAKKEGADALLTGDANHTYYHLAKELDIAIISGGHYLTETIGVKRFGAKLSDRYDLETVFIDIPTDL